MVGNFRLFRTVKNLYVTKEFARYIFPSLKKLVGERVADVLPALENFFLERLQTPAGWEPVHWQKAIGPFVAARQLSGHPVAISRWDGIVTTTSPAPSLQSLFDSRDMRWYFC